MNNSKSAIMIIDSNFFTLFKMQVIFKDVINLEILSPLNVQEAIPILMTKNIEFVYIEINKNGIIDIDSIHLIRSLKPNLKIIIFTNFVEFEIIEKLICNIPNCFLLRKVSTRKAIFESFSW